VAYRFGVSRSVLCATPAYLERHGVPAHPDDLGAHRALVYTLAAAGNVTKLTRDGVTETVRRAGHLRVNNTLALRLATLADLGIARIPSFVVAPDIASGALVQVLPAWKMPELGIHAVYPSRDYLPRKTRAFIDFFAAHLGDPPYWEKMF
jgi:DNA-binding transcriptional LysR family regulator